MTTSTGMIMSMIMSTITITETNSPAYQRVSFN